VLENILGNSNINPLRYEGFKEYPIPSMEDNEESLHVEFVPTIYAEVSDYESYEVPKEEVSIPEYFSLTETVRASFKPFYSNYLQDVIKKEIAFVNMPDISAYGWTFPNDPEAPIYVNTAYANTQEQVNSTIIHERNHEQTRTYHEPPAMHEMRVRLDTNTSYLG